MLVAVLSDIHSNLEALEAVLAVADDAGATTTLVLGDIVGYNADPDAVIRRLAERPETTLIAGNHDLAATGRFDTTWFNSVAAAAIDWTRDAMSPQSADLLSALLPRREDPMALLVHGSVVDPATEYVTTTKRARASFDAHPFGLCFFGHTHMPTAFTADGGVQGEVLTDGRAFPLRAGARYMLNPGSVGQPRDSDPRASFMLYDTVEQTAMVRRIPYDVATAQDKIHAAGLPPILADRLAEGR